MDGVSSETNEENDNRERPVRRRHSSILKPPRSPLQDLRNGNEIVQESNTLRNKKSSRRVSFADTIKVFQTVSHMKTVRKSEIIETEARENVLCIQNKNSEDNYCEIAGMNTLLCAPIQIQMQQREFPFTEHNHERKHAGDQTVIFSDENQMDLTASHTVMISKGLLDRTKSEKSTKIETRSFLTNLKHNAGDSRIKTEKLSMDQNTSSEKKKNSSDFIKRLKRGKYSASPSTGPDKENSEILIYSKGSNTAYSTHQMQVAFNVDENSNNMTRIFQEQDEGMNFTQCHTANIETLVPTTGEANLREFEGDITIYRDDCMDLTVNRTVQILPSADNLSEKENQTQNVKLDVKTVCETKVPGKETFFQNKINAIVQDSSLNPQDKIHITRSHIIESETQTVTQTSNQDTRTLTATPDSICYTPDIQGYKTVFYSSCNDAMELTKCLSSLREEENLLKHDGNSKMCPSPDGIPFLIEKTIYLGEDSMDITKSHTVAIDNQIFKQEESDVQVAAASISDKKMMLQNPIIVSEDEKMNLSCSSVAHIFKERLQQSSKEPVSISLTDKKTELLAGKVVDLTESHTSSLGSHASLASYTLITNNTSKSHSQSKSPLDEWEKKIKNITPSPQPNISKNIVTDIQSKEKHRSVNFLPHLNKDPLLSTDYNQNTAINHNIVYSGAVLDKQVLLGNNRHTVLSEQSLFSTSKPLFAREEQSVVKNYDISENSHLVNSILGQNSKLPESPKKNLDDSTPNCSHEKMTICSEENQTMDLTKSHTVVTGFGPSEVQELSETNLKYRASRLTTVNRQVATEVEKCDKSPVEKTGLFISNKRNVLDDKAVQNPGFLMEKQNVNIHERKSFGGLKIDKTIVFSEDDENDMDITKSYTVELNHRPLLDKNDSHLAGTSKTILYACGQDDMEITGSHTTVLGCKTHLASEKTSGPVDKTVMFVDYHDELEMTKSHTVFIDYQAQERTGLPDTSTFELAKRKSLQKSEVASSGEEDKVFFLENNESDNPTAKGSQLTGLKKWSNVGPIEKGVAVKADDSMEVSKLTTRENINNVEKAGFVNEYLSGKSQRRKSLTLKNDKTIAFSENDKNEVNITQSCMVEKSNKSALEDKEDFNLVPLTGTSKIILYSCGHDDMEITASHPTVSDCKTVLPDEITRPVDKTVMFVDNYNDLEVTKSHTVFIDCQATEKMLQEYPKFGIPKDDNYVQETTNKQVLAIENKIVLHPKQKKYHTIPLNPTNTFSGNHSEMEIKFCRAAMDEEVMENVVDQACTLEKAEIESCHLNSTDRRNVDFISSPIAAICGSLDKSACLPNDISSNITFLLNKEKANNCPVQNDLAYADDLASKYYLDSKGLPFSASLLEKKEAIWTDSRGQLNCSMTLLKDEDLIKKPQNLSANQTLVYSQNLGEITKLNSKRVSFKLPKDQIEAFVDDICDASQPHLSTQQLPLTQNRQNVICKSEAILSKSGNKSLNFIIENSSPTYENESKILSNEKQFAIACKKEIQENNQTAKCNTAVDFHSNSNSATQIIQTHTNARNASDHIITSNVPCISSIKPNMNNLNGKTEEFLDSQTVPTLPPQEELLELGGKAHDNVSVVQPTEIHNINIVSINAKDNGDEENKNFQNGADTTSVPLKTVVKDKMRRCSLGIFLPRLPNKRNCSVTGIDDLEQIPADTTDINHLEIQQVSRKDSDIGSVAANLNLSPSEYINEENLPICPGEINFSDTISIEIEEKSLIETYQKEILPSENKMEETCNNQKRTWVQEDNDVQKEKKIIKYDIKLSDTTQDQEIFDHHNEGDIDKNVNSVLIKSLSRTPSSCSSSLDSIKADGTSLDFSTYRSNQMESRFLRDTICEESLREKLKDGRITIREFFILLQVHILIQKPRQSNLPAKFTTNTSPTPEDLILRQYVYGPKIQIYREDCEILRQKIEELKVSSLTQDKLLTDVNRNLWEKMRYSSDEELKAFGVYVNKIKSCVTKVTKVFTHQGKVTLYSKLVQSAQNEREKLQIRIDEMDNILKKINNCLSEVEIETKNLEDEEKDNPVEEWDSEMRAAEKELQQLKTNEEELQRKLLELEVQKEQTLTQIDFMQKQTNRTEELLNQLSLSEWDVIEWTDDQAVFTFVYDTIELIITFGEPVVGLPFLDKAHRKITDLNFQSLLDEDKAPTSSLLVHKLIFQYIEEQESWKKKCTTQHQVPKMLQELSPIVNNCRLLGEEIEFLKKWGPNYNLMDIDVNNTELKLLFSSSVAFAKFAVTLSLSAHYPLVPLPFTIQNHLGNTSQDEIAAVIYKVPLADNYLKNIVKQIYQDLLQGCHFYC
ncbi:kinetochore scaffold 1 isoform X2 [Marmota marmota marmota]|uniref:kinetochore scaffold 1 isoform X2 n=1 Tax=Marmota marmota marmota TaxID=9994 RepID=UPI002093BB68|nr:kinetochore scaffold 1 isoform X2 [Marmota marmota marmota]